MASGEVKSGQQLKVERTTAKRLFSHLANSILRTEEELRDIFYRLTMEAEKVMEANDDVEAGLIAELEAETNSAGVPVLTKQQKADIVKTANECELKLKEVKGLIQETLCANFAGDELSTARQAAEAACELTAATKPNGNQEAYDFILTTTHLKEMELYVPKLICREADFIQARLKEDAEGLTQTDNAFIHPVPTIKLKPTAKFAGSKRDFHRW